MKRFLSISVVSLFYLAIVFGVISYMVIPNVKVLNEINTKQNISEEEKNKLVESINNKYDELENNIKESYSSRLKQIDEELISKNSEENKEFMTNGFSDTYYRLNTEIANLNKEKFEINKKQDTELNSNKAKRNTELRAINGQNSDSFFKKSKSIVLIVVGGLILLFPILVTISKFNVLTILLNRVKNSWSQIDVLLKQRADLIPNIVSTVKAYSNYEKDTLTSVIDARNEVMSAKTKEEEIIANKKLNYGVNKLLVLQEDYPELKADENYMSLHKNLKEIEDNIASLRQEYNNNVLRYKNKVETFPNNIFANIFGFKSQVFFKIDDDERENVNINL